MPIDDAAIRRIVLSNPIPDRLFRDLREAPLVKYPRRHVGGVMSAELYETLKMLCRTTATNVELGEQLGISPEAAKDRVKRLLAYFDVRNRTALVALCYRERIV